MKILLKGKNFMVGIVIVSHSAPLAEATADLAGLMAKGLPIRAAGGMEDGGFGTSYEKIEQAILDIYSEDGVLILADMGSSVMTTELVLEEMEDKNVKLADAPLVEGAVASAVEAAAGGNLEAVVSAAEEAGKFSKING